MGVRVGFPVGGFAFGIRVRGRGIVRPPSFRVAGSGVRSSWTHSHHHDSLSRSSHHLSVQFFLAREVQHERVQRLCTRWLLAEGFAALSPIGARRQSAAWTCGQATSRRPRQWPGGPLSLGPAHSLPHFCGHPVRRLLGTGLRIRGLVAWARAPAVGVPAPRSPSLGLGGRVVVVSVCAVRRRPLSSFGRVLRVVGTPGSPLFGLGGRFLVSSVWQRVVGPSLCSGVRWSRSCASRRSPRVVGPARVVLVPWASWLPWCPVVPPPVIAVSRRSRELGLHLIRGEFPPMPPSLGWCGWGRAGPFVRAGVPVWHLLIHEFGASLCFGVVAVLVYDSVSGLRGGAGAPPRPRRRASARRLRALLGSLAALLFAGRRRRCGYCSAAHRSLSGE